MSQHICLVRPPSLPGYHDTDIKEDPMLCGILGYLHALAFPADRVDIFDFQLQKDIDYTNLLQKNYTDYVLAARDVGESYHYTMRLAHLLSAKTKAKIWLYGQVAPLRFHNTLPPRTEIVIQSENELATKLGLPSDAVHFTKDLQFISYYDKITLESWQLQRIKGCLETSRGCPYKCKFCFITVGQSYEKRWQTRTNETIMQDIKSYISKGIHKFVFLDSEFLGRNPKQHAQRRELLQRIIDELPPIEYMILCRADTLMMFDDFKLFQKSGLRKILVGVESLYQPDLDALNKSANLATMIAGITGLIEHDVNCCLTFITFNRNTTITGIRSNLDQLEKLYNHPKARYLGMPNFSFNLEVMRGDEAMDNQLSDNTYLKPILWARGQLDYAAAAFPIDMEPLIEIYRLLQYEWVVKKNTLLRNKHHAQPEELHKINLWLDGLGKFCIRIMRYYLDQFEQGKLTFDTMKPAIENLFKEYIEFNKILPDGLNDLEVYEDHAQYLSYEKPLPAEDHGWDQRIPMVNELCEFNAETT